jgi:glucuronoarabinoxylan endo-1,4-beta-xylanase
MKQTKTTPSPSLRPLHVRGWIVAWATAATLPTCIVRTQADIDARAEASKLAQAQAEAEAAEEVPEIDGERGPAVAVRATVDVTQRFQTLEGFGASVAWYQDRIVGETPEGVYELLFTELGLDILRFRNRFERSDPDDAKLEHEVEIYKRATEALGHPPKLLMSSWSPPASLKASGKEKCGGEPECTLKKEDGKFVYDKFADWWRRSLEHYAELGLKPDFVSFQNEPDFIPPSWEGCKFVPVETEEYPSYGKQLEVLAASFKTLEHQPKLLGPEVLGIHYQRVQNYMANLDPSLLYGVAHHIYERGSDDVWDWRDPGPDSFNDELHAVAQLTNKPLFQTEFNTDEDRGKDGGFETAWLMHNSLVVEGAAGWLYWELYWTGLKGLAGMIGREPKPRDHYYSMRHYSRFTDPGYVRVGAETNQEEMLSSAYLAPDGSRLVVVLLNSAPEHVDIAVAAEGFAHTKSQAFRTIYRPGASKRWQQLDASAGPLRMPERSVVTLVLER